MPFIGTQPQVGAYSKLDAITTSATATYNLTLNSGAYYPSSANHLMVSLNGVMQAPQDSFTISGATIIFASTLASTDSIDFIMALGDVLDIGTPSDGTVVTAKIQNAAVTDAKIATGITATKLTGALPAISGSALTGVSKTFSRSRIYVDGAATTATTNTRIVRFTNTVESTGSDITYTDSTSLGNKFVINTAGVYNVAYSAVFASASWFGISVNSTQLTTYINSITAADRIAIAHTSAINVVDQCSVSYRFAAGDVVRAHINNVGVTTATGRAGTAFTIERIS